MNKSLYLGLGALIGAAGGSAVTYFLTKSVFENRAAEVIEDYAEHCEERIERIKEEYQDKLVGDLDRHCQDKEEAKSEDDPEETAIRNNEGVKKYHHHEGDKLPEYGSKRIFRKTTKEEEMAKKEVNAKEIAEGVYLGSDKEKQTIDVLFRLEGDKVEEIWGYKTDNETTCQARFGKSLIDIIGVDNDDILDWFEPDDGVAVKYFRNYDMDMDFEIVAHCDPETYYEES